MFERLTERARKVILHAQEEALYFKHNYIGTEHLLLGLLRAEGGIAAEVLGRLGVTSREARNQVEGIVGHGEEEADTHVPFTPRSKKVLELSLQEALDLSHNYIGTEHLLLGLSQEKEGVAARVLENLHVEPERVRREVIRTLEGSGREEMPWEEPSSAPDEIMIFRGRVSGLEAGSFVWELDYEYAARDTAGEAVDHDELVAEVMSVLEGMDELATLEDAVAMIGTRVLGEFPAIRTATVGACWSRHPVTLPAFECEVSRTFHR